MHKLDRLHDNNPNNTFCRIIRTTTQIVFRPQLGITLYNIVIIWRKHGSFFYLKPAMCKNPYL